MKILIERNGEDINVLKDYSLEDRGEISHFLMELELIKMDLMQLWVELSESQESFGGSDGENEGEEDNIESGK